MYKLQNNMMNKKIKQILHVAFKQMQNNYDINIVDYIYNNAKKIINMCVDNNYNVKFNYCVFQIIDKKYKYDYIDIDYNIYDDDLLYIIDENNVLLFVVNYYFDIYINKNLFKNNYNKMLNETFNTNKYNENDIKNILNNYNFKQK